MGETIDVGRLEFWMTRTAEMIPADIIAEDKQDIRALRSGLRKGGAKSSAEHEAQKEKTMHSRIMNGSQMGVNPRASLVWACSWSPLKSALSHLATASNWLASKLLPSLNNHSEKET
jgi:hypothetical protein